MKYSIIRSAEFVKKNNEWPWNELERFYSGISLPLFILTNNDFTRQIPIVKVRRNTYYSLPYFSFGGERILGNEYSDILESASGQLDVVIKYRMHSCENLLSMSKTHALLPLPSCHQEYLSNLSRNARSKIKRSQKAGFKIKIIKGSEIDRANLLDFYSIYIDNIHRLRSIPYRLGFFKNLLKSFGDSSDLFLVYFKDKVVAGGINVGLGEVYENTYFCSLGAYRKQYVTYYLYFEIVRYAIANDKLNFSFGRSSAGSSLESFKKHLGADISYVKSNITPLKEDRTLELMVRFLPKNVRRLLGFMFSHRVY